jgi:radical SAM superfamily enzyme YgiQ (UPF0313 family)
MKILFVHPCNPNDIEYKIAGATPYLGAKSLFAPHGLATVAALVPGEHTVVIHDEAIKGPIEESIDSNNHYDIMGLHLTTNQINRCNKIAAYFESHHPETYRIAGGIGASFISKEKTTAFQTVFHGEAEESWPEFLNDFKEGKPKKIYRKLSHPDMKMVPIPRWDLIAKDLESYGTLSIQTTRGCPFDCSFCNVIYTYGRKMRCKSVQQVIDEVKLFYNLGVKTIFFADDNFAGNRTYAKEVLHALKEVNNSFDLPLTFMTQLDITVAKDPELLELLADCNFVELMIGVEAIDPETLKEMNKVQNLKDDILESVKTIQSYGLIVFAHMIAGFDNDDTSVFDRTEAFFKEAGITEYLLHPLMAPPGTKLWYKMKKESRVIHTENLDPDTTDIVSNVIPKQMTRIELMEGLIQFWEKVNTPEANMERALVYINNIKRIPKAKRPGLKGLRRMRKILFGSINYFMFKAPRADRKAFMTLMKTISRKSPNLVSRVMYLYTNYLMNRSRIGYYIEILKNQIELEKKHPEIIVPMEPTTPIPDAIIEHSGRIFDETYSILRDTIAVKDQMYSAAIESITDFSDKFGNEFKVLDDFQLKNLKECVTRVANAGDWRNETFLNKEELPLGKPPAGFFRDIVTTLDSNIRFKEENRI